MLVAADGAEQDLRHAVRVGGAKQGVAYLFVQESTTDGAVTLDLKTHTDLDAPPSKWVVAGSGSAGGAGKLETIAIRFSDPAEWLTWSLSGGDAGAVVRFSLVVYLDEP